MLKRLLIISGCVACAVATVLFFTNSKPPALEWHDMSCWNNSTFQVLRNVRPLTEELLRARREAKKNNEHSKYEVLDDGSVSLFMTRYVDLLEIIDDLQNQNLTKEERAKLEEKRRKFHRQSCVMIEEKYGMGSDPREFAGFFLQLGTPKSLGKFSQQFRELILSLVALSPMPEEIFSDFTSLPPYVAFDDIKPVRSMFGDNVEVIDFGPYISDEFKQKGDTTYELIGMALGTLGHVWAYVKDQFEDNPQWWKVDDYKKIVDPKENPPTTREDLKKDGVEAVYVMLYKRIVPVDNVIDRLAQALGSIR